MMKHTLLAVFLFTSAALAADVYTPTDAERARWTMDDMMTWRTAIQAYATDHHEYPDVKTIEQLQAAVEPIYIIHAPLHDAWGHAYRYERLTPTTFRLVSAGVDGQFDESSWSTAAKKLSFDADAVVTSEGRWMFRSWEFK